MAAAIRLASEGKQVRLLESSGALGGKAGTVSIDGVEMDTGPSVLTMPEVFRSLFARAQLSPEEGVELLTPDPNFLYRFADGVELFVHHDLPRTLESVAEVFGSKAMHQLARYLDHAGRIWKAAAPHFVFDQAPTLPRLLLGGPKVLSLLGEIDPLRSLTASIRRHVDEPHLVQLLERYATYNGSDPRRAPATLGCIAHVELALGGYGVRGGIHELVRALGRALTKLGVEVLLRAPVERIATRNGQVTGVMVNGELLGANQIVWNADVGLLPEMASELGRYASREKPSMSGYVALIRAERRPSRSAHAVLFPELYHEEFADIFDRGRAPVAPTVYVCAQEKCHLRAGWPEHEPLFCMTNAPPLSSAQIELDRSQCALQVQATLLRAGLATPAAEVLWDRTPRELAERFPGSQGALYGAASNDRGSAFRRPKNRSPALKGLYLASGSAHPGGGMPLAAQSGILAAEAILQDLTS